MLATRSRVLLRRCLRAQSTKAQSTPPASVLREEVKSGKDRETEKHVEDMFETLTDEFVIGTSNGLRGRQFATLKDERQALRNLVPPPGSPARVASLQQQDFFSQEPDTDEFAPSYREIYPGDFVEVRRNNIVSHGIVIDFVIGSDSAAKVLSLVSSGELWPHLPSDVQFTIPGFVDMDTVVACGNTMKVRNPLEQKIRLETIKRIRTFEREVEDKFRGIGRRVTRIYPLLASSNPSVWAKVTTKQALSVIDSRESPPATVLLAMHKHLMMRHQYFVCDETMHLRTHSFFVRPRNEVENIEKVVQWVVERSAYLEAFISKARELVQNSRETQQKRESMAPGVEKSSTGIEFTQQDMDIIFFLKCSIRQRRSIQSDPYTNYARSIVNETGLYPTTITAQITHKFLQEIGLLAPWDDPTNHDHGSQLNMRTLEEVITLEEEITPLPKTISLQPIATLSEGVNPDLSAAFGELYKHDIVESSRHDFGDLPVFVIDDMGAEELDDGISIEPVQGSKDKVWIHVHIADPTLLLPPDHALARRAEIKFSTRYLLQGSQPMLPKEFTSLVQLGAKQAGGQRAITFSVMIDSGGNMTDYQVRASVVRNLQAMTYGDVDSIMRWGYYGDLTPFDPPPPPHSPDPSLVKWRDNFQMIHKAMSSIVQKRNHEGFIGPYLPQPEPKAKNQPFPDDPKNSREPTTFYGTADIQYAVADLGASGGSRLMVAECMKLACRAASRWFLAQGIPGVRRTMDPYEPITILGGSLDYLRELQKKNGCVHLVELQKARVLQPKTAYLLEPKGHSSLGVPDGEGYIRVTSPLRRYMDLVHHWQIKHVLAGGSVPSLPFSQTVLADRLLPWTQKERISAGADNKQKQYWATKYIAERFSLPADDPRVGPLHNLQGRIYTLPRWDPVFRRYNTTVMIDSLGMKARIASSSELDMPPVGASVTVRVNEVELDIRPSIHVEFV